MPFRTSLVKDKSGIAFADGILYAFCGSCVKCQKLQIYQDPINQFGHVSNMTLCLKTSNKPLQGTERCTIADNVSRTDKVPTKFVSSD